ncbi:MAG: hypothetical protein KGY76_09765 [Candidatus Thermoplasmatota archaeon]|nr:hypothetical protein [Candidatus Thermoplasmatota archaeon]
MGEKPKVWIFYSSRTEPELLTFYADGLAYLKDHEIEMEVIDISEDTKKAKEFDVSSTPTVLIEKEGEVIEEYEVISYLDGILERDELKRIFEES